MWLTALHTPPAMIQLAVISVPVFVASVGMESLALVSHACILHLNVKVSKSCFNGLLLVMVN